LEQKLAFLTLKVLYFKNFCSLKLVWHRLIEQSFTFQNLFYKLWCFLMELWAIKVKIPV